MTAAVRQSGPWRPAGSAVPQSGEAPEPSLDDRLNWIQREYAGTPLELIGHLLGVGLVTGVFRSIDDNGPWLLWLALCACVLLARWVLHHRLGGEGDFIAHGRWLRWDRRNRALRLMQGLVTGLACGVYQPLASGVHQSTLMVVVFVCLVGAIPSMAGRLSGLVAYAVAAVGPLTLAVAWDTTDEDHLHLMGSLVLLMALVVGLVKNQRAVQWHWLHQKHRVDQLRLQLADQAAQAQVARLSAELGRQAQIQWMAAAGHDLRQPLLALHLQAQLLRARLFEPRDTALLEAMSRGLQSLELLINDLLDGARSETGLRTPRLQLVQLGDIYRRLQSQLGPCAFERGLSLTWRGAHRQVWADPLMVERCVRNLALNALAHTESGGVLVAARSRGGQLVIQVWDSGCGLRPEDERRLFHDHPAPVGPATPAVVPFAALGQDIQQSCGLGLGIVRRLAHLMGAEVAARSVAGRGSVFELRFNPAPAGEPED